MGAPLKILSSCILAADNWTTVLSSYKASSAISLFGAFFLSKIAVETSFFSGAGGLLLLIVHLIFYF